MTGSMFLLLGAALFTPPPPVAPIDPACAAASAPAQGESAETLTDKGLEAMGAGDSAAAEGLFRRAATAEGGDVARARAVRMLVDLHVGRGGAAEFEPLLACMRSDAGVHARAWLAYRQGRYQDAANLLQPLVRPRHHTLPRWSTVHEDLGDAYARLGRKADAQAQWRIALATDYDPGGTGWDRSALERKLADALAAPAGAEPLLPLQRYHDAVSILDLASVKRTEAGRRYDKLVLLAKDENGGAYGIDSYEVDCSQERARVLGVRGFDAAGKQVRSVEELPWRADLTGEPWLSTERALVCSVDPDARLAPRTRSALELLQAYRRGSPLFDAP